MQLPIPDDWDGQDFECVQIQWPNSAKWFAILAGLITTPTRGRFWDANTGSIKGVQAIGYEIDQRNMPFISCDGETVITINGETYTRYIESLEGDFLMSLCGYNPKAFKIESGTLYVRDFCGEWVAIGATNAQPDYPSPDDIFPDPVPDGLVDSTPCAMALKLATFVYNIVAAALASSDGADPLYGVFDFQDDLQGAFPTIDLSFSDTFNLFFNTFALNVAGYETETLNLAAIQWLACNWAPLIPQTNSGISSSVYSDLISASDGALKNAFGDSAFYGFGRTMRFAWQDALKAIGPKDAQKITYYVQPSGLEDCLCPDEEPAYTGSVRFTGSHTTADNPSWLTSSAENNGKRLVIEWRAPAGDWKNDGNLRFGMVMDGPITSVKIVTKPVPGYDVPKYEWYTENCLTADPATTWVKHRFGSAWGHVYTTTAYGEMTGVVTANTPPQTDTDFEWYARKCPQTGGGAVTYKCTLEITEINGVPV